MIEEMAAGTLIQTRSGMGAKDVLSFARKIPALVRLAAGEIRWRDRVDFATDEWRFRRIYQKFRDFTMISEADYVANLRLATLVAEIPGVIVECGTWRGGMIAGIADVLGPYKRRYFLFDSYEGLPPATVVDGVDAIEWQSKKISPDYHNNCTASEEEAHSAMSMSAAKDYEITKGWFKDTLPNAKLGESIALLRMDADWYDSTKCILDNLASQMTPGGIIIVDDYHTWEGCTIAVNEFAAARKWRIKESPYAEVCFIVA